MAEYDDSVLQPLPAQSGGWQPALVGGAGQPTPLVDQSSTQIHRGFAAGVMEGLPSLDRLQRPRFDPDPNFDPYAAALVRGNMGDVSMLETARSQDEFDWLSNRIDERRRRYSRDVAGSPYAAVAGGVISEVFWPSNAIPLLGPAARLGTAFTRVAQYSGIAGLEQSLATASSSERSVEEAAMNLAMGAASMAALQTIMTGGSRALGRLSRTPEKVVEDYVQAEAAAARVKGESTGQDPFDPVERPEARSVGAQGAGTIQTDAERIWANGMADAFGAEHMPNLVTPLTRIIHATDVPEVGETGELLMEIGYLLNKNRKGVRSDYSVENNLRTRWRPVHAGWRQSLDIEYAEHLKELGGKPVAEGMPGSSLLTDIGQRMKGGTSHQDFRRLVWEDLARGSEDAPNWRPTAAVRRASQRTRAMYDELIDEAMELDLHVKDLRAKLEKATDPVDIQSIRKTMDDRTDAIKRNKKRFVNVIFDKEKIRANRTEFERFVMVKKRLSPAEASKAVDEVLQQRPFFDLNDDNRVGTPRSLHQRTLVDDPLEWREWLDDDVLNGGTLYMRTMSPDIELAKMFGAADMKEQLDDIRAAYQRKIDAATTAAEKKRLQKDRDGRLEDLMAVRDLIRGTYMIPPDPEHVVSRSIRIAKNWNAATMLTGALAAVPDLARTATANGLAKSFGSLFEALRNPELYKMAKSEARSVGEAWDIVLGTRAAIFSDIGEATGAFSKAERFAAEVGQQSFNLNLMNFWNETMKSASSLVVSTKILSDVEALVSGRASKKATERLAASFIDEDMARRIAAESANWHRTDHNIIAQASTWKDQGAADAFRAALSRELNIVILTPGVAERPLWMSQTLDKTLGMKPGEAPTWLSQNYLSLVAQFKSFMMSSTYRTLIPMLQQRDRDVVAMLAIATGLGVMIDHIRSEQGGYAPPSSLFDALLSGVDRSGVLGWYLEPNNALERLSGNTLGLRPWFGDARPYDPSGRTIAGVIAGPTGQQIANIAGVVGDIAGGEYDQWTAKGIRKTLPLQNVAHFDWAFDQIESGLRGAGYMFPDEKDEYSPGPGALSVPYQ